MQSLLRLARPAAAAVVLASALTGCLKSDQTITVYPDSSGKIQMKTTLLGMMAQMAKMGGPGGQMGGPGGAPAEKPDPFEILKKDVGGKVYWANLKAEDGTDGSYTLSGTGYFESVNDIQRDQGKMTFTKDAATGGYLLEMKPEIPNEITGEKKEGAPELTPEQEQMQKQMLEMMKGMMAGFDMKVTIVMPGNVTKAEGMKATEGTRNATFALGEKELLAIMEKKEKPPKEMKVTSGPADDKALEGELATFKKELADAKANAAKEAEEKAAKKKADAEKGGATPPPSGDGEKKPEGKKPTDF